MPPKPGFLRRFERRMTHAAALSGALFTGLAGPGNGQETRVGAVIGSVVDQATRRPVASAEVRLTGTTHRTSTDSAGVFRMVGLVGGRYRLEIEHIAYGRHALEIDVIPAEATRLQLSLSPVAIQLEPIEVDVLSREEVRARGAGYRRDVVTRQDIARWQGTNMTLAEVLRTQVPTVRVRRLERVVGSPICIELRSYRALSNECQSPKVYMDGVPITDPIFLYGLIDLSDIESMEVVPATEAGVRFGTGALHGALLITTRRPGRPLRPETVGRSTRFDWSQDEHGHSTAKVLLISGLANAVGIGIGVTAARQCLHLRAPSNDSLVSECSLVPTLGGAAAALVLPALGSGYGSLLGGRTDSSQGRIGPATVGAAMTLVPGYALVMTGERNESAGLKAAGYAMLFVGTPLISTLSDFLFRKLRGTGVEERESPF